MYSALWISHDRPDDRAEFHDQLQTILESALAESDLDVELSADFLLGHHHPDWEKGDPCPECGDNQVVVSTRRDDSYWSSDGDFQYSKDIRATDDTLGIVCSNCKTILREVPYRPLD